MDLNAPPAQLGEEDVRINVEAALKHHLAELGIATEASYEQPITLLHGSGRADAVYGFGIIEYKRPGVIATPHGRKKPVEQLSSVHHFAPFLVATACSIRPFRDV